MLSDTEAIAARLRKDVEAVMGTALPVTLLVLERRFAKLLLGAVVSLFWLTGRRACVLETAAT